MAEDLRQRIGEALANAECEKQPRCADCMTDAVMAVRDSELESLRQRADTAEAAVARARHVCHKAMAEKDAPGQWLVAQQVLAAIDATEETDARQ